MYILFDFFSVKVYAIIHTLEVQGNKGCAEFYVQASRDNALNLKPLERKFVDFEVDRNESPYITAYKTASGTYTVDKFTTDENGEMKVEKVEKPNIFNGWEDDYSTT